MTKCDKIYLSMKAVDLTKQLKPYKSGWVAMLDNEVVVHAKNFELVIKKVKKIKKSSKDILLVPASDNYFGFVTSING